jgi:hypothetical protein
MSCEQVRRLIYALPRAEWTVEQRERIERHANACAECRTHLELEARLESSLCALPDPEPPTSFADAVMARIAARHVSHAKAPSRVWQIAGDSAKSVGIAIGLGAYLFRLFEKGAMFQPPRTGEALDMLLGGAFLDPLMQAFVAGVILYLAGLFSSFRSLDESRLKSAGAR